jgi:hypothetical protein
MWNRWNDMANNTDAHGMLHLFAFFYNDVPEADAANIKRDHAAPSRTKEGAAHGLLCTATSGFPRAWQPFYTDFDVRLMVPGY